MSSSVLHPRREDIRASPPTYPTTAAHGPTRASSECAPCSELENNVKYNNESSVVSSRIGEKNDIIRELRAEKALLLHEKVDLEHQLGQLAKMCNAATHRAQQAEARAAESEAKRKSLALAFESFKASASADHEALATSIRQHALSEQAPGKLSPDVSSFVAKISSLERQGDELRARVRRDATRRNQLEEGLSAELGRARKMGLLVADLLRSEEELVATTGAVDHRGRSGAGGGAGSSTGGGGGTRGLAVWNKRQWFMRHALSQLRALLAADDHSQKQQQQQQQSGTHRTGGGGGGGGGCSNASGGGLGGGGFGLSTRAENTDRHGSIGEQRSYSDDCGLVGASDAEAQDEIAVLKKELALTKDRLQQEVQSRGRLAAENNRLSAQLWGPSFQDLAGTAALLPRQQQQLKQRSTHGQIHESGEHHHRSAKHHVEQEGSVHRQQQVMQLPTPPPPSNRTHAEEDRRAPPQSTEANAILFRTRENNQNHLLATGDQRGAQAPSERLESSESGRGACEGGLSLLPSWKPASPFLGCNGDFVETGCGASGGSGFSYPEQRRDLRSGDWS